MGPALSKGKFSRLLNEKDVERDRKKKKLIFNERVSGLGPSLFGGPVVKADADGYARTVVGGRKDSERVRGVTGDLSRLPVTGWRIMG